MDIQKTQMRPESEQVQKLWLLVGMGALFYLLIHTLHTLFIGVPAAFSGKQHQALWAFTIIMVVVLLPVLLSFLRASQILAWIVFLIGVLGTLLMTLVAWQYGVAAGAGYITLTVVVFVLIPQGTALWRTLGWARARSW